VTADIATNCELGNDASNTLENAYPAANNIRRGPHNNDSGHQIVEETLSY